MRIEVNGKQIIFAGQLAMTENNPMFSDEISFSLQATAPDDDNGVNRAIFGFINRPDISDNQTKELPAKIIGKSFFLSGTIVVNWQGSAFNFYFKQNGDFWTKIKDKYLSDIEFEKVVFEVPKNYTEMLAYMAEINPEISNNFAFPFIISSEKVNSTMGLKMDFDNINNDFKHESLHIPFIPLFYLRYIYTEIFKRNGIFISNEDVFAKNDDLNRVIFVNNYILNEFSIDHTVVSHMENLITKITNTTDPVVTTILNHNLVTNQLISISSLESNPPIENRVFQVEVVDDKNFKLIGEDFSKYEEYNRAHFVADTIVKHIDVYPINNSIVITTVHTIEGEALVEKFYRLYSSDYNDFVSGHKVDDNTIFVRVPYDINIATHIYTGLHLLENKSILFENWPQNEGYINLLAGVETEFVGIDPSNHVPYLKINDFLKECQKLFGIVPFVRNSVDIKSYNDILKQTDFIDLTPFTEEITEIDNPGITGYKLSFKADGSDEYYKTRLPVQTIDAKYNLLPSVLANSDLPVMGSETNDLRLVEVENAFYVYNKSFLNADFNWKFLCYNLLDSSTGDAKFTIDSAFSTLIAAQTLFNSYHFPEFGVPFSNKNFHNDIKMAPRVLYNHGVVTNPYAMTYASGEIQPYYGNLLPQSNLIFRWEGLNGIYDKCLKNRIYWEINVRKDIKTTIHYPGYLTSNFDFSKKYRIRNVNYLVKSRKYTLDFAYDRVKWNESELAKV